jgi:hypothetical protein
MEGKEDSGAEELGWEGKSLLPMLTFKLVFRDS